MSISNIKARLKKIESLRKAKHKAKDRAKNRLTAEERREARYYAYAKKIGCPIDQIHNFERARIIPQKKQLQFHAAARQCDLPDGPDQIALGGSRGPGKALALDTPIPTVDGYKLMRDIMPGDFVFSPEGQPTLVTGVSDIQYDRTCYEVVFSDGARIVADADHLWVTFTKKDRIAQVKRTPEYREKRRAKRPLRGTGARPWIVERNQAMAHEYLAQPIPTTKTTQEIRDTLYHRKEINHAIPVSEPLQLPDADLPLDPYLLGVWLGDGTTVRGDITSADQEILDSFIAGGFKPIHMARYGYRMEGLTSVLQDVGVWKQKHIPILYLRASFAQRLALLQGIMDTDGCVDKDGGCEIILTNQRLIRDTFQLIMSLGIKASFKTEQAKLNGEVIGPKWRVNFSTALPVFRLTRKINAQKREGLTRIVKLRFITEVNPVESVPVKCITVFDPSHCYLAGDRLIPTHNSFAIFAQIALDDCQRFPNLKVLYLRSVGRKAKEQMEDLRKSILFNIRHEYQRGPGVIIFPNESRIMVGFFRDDRDIDNYLGIEYDIICIEEATTLSLSKFRTLRDSNRTSKPGWRPRIYLSTNPGGIGHVWFRERFILPYRSRTEHYTRFIPATVDDNRFVDDDYKRKLEENTGWKLRAYRYGDWDIAAGQFFTTFRAERNGKPHHVVEPFTIPKNWKVWCSLDYGFTHPTVCYLLTQDNDGNIYVVAEHKQAKLLVKQHAELIKAMLARHGFTIYDLDTFVAGTDVFAKRGTGADIAEQYNEEGIQLWPANTDRINGASEMMSLLGDVDAERPVDSRLFIFSTCVGLIECLPMLEHDPNRPEDVLKVDVDEDGNGGDDCFVAGTLITTDKGDCPIELIRPGDLVLTRAGYKPVKDIWISGGGKDRPVVEVSLSNGASIIATPNHRVFTPKHGWVSLDTLRYGDIVLSVDDNKYYRGEQWQYQKQLSSMGLSLDVIQNQRSALIGSTTGLVEIIESAASGHFTKRFGNLYTGRSLTDSIFTTLTKTHSITTSQILRPNSLPSTWQNTLPILSTLTGNVPTWLTYKTLPPLGTAPMRVGLGTRNMGEPLGKVVSQPLPLVSNAENPTRRSTQANQSFALTNVKRSGEEIAVLTTLLSHVKDAGKILPLTNMINCASVPVRVESVMEAGKNRTYAIHVTDQHEYYANGVLVRNCYDAVRYGVMAVKSMSSIA